MKKVDVAPSADDAQVKVEKLIEALRLELRPHGINVFAVAPGTLLPKFEPVATEATPES